MEQVDDMLTARQLAILNLVAAGYTTKEISLELGIAKQTVKNHLTDVFIRLGVSGRCQAVLEAYRQGWIGGDGTMPPSTGKRRPEHRRLRRSTWDLALDLICSAMLVVTSACLLYLWSWGAWHDPNRFIEVSEVFMLSVLVAIGAVVFFYRAYRSLRKGG